MITWRGMVGTVAAVIAVAGGCSSDGAPAADGSNAACPGTEGAKPAKAILACTESAIAFVETEISSGTGILIKSKGEHYLLTNAHVVDPFASANVRLGTKDHENVPVVGVDVAADIAVLGPLHGTLPKPLAIADGDGLERGDDVFLVGFPGEAQPDDLEVTIASGIVSRTRSVKEFDQTYIQTDASIGGGQSGGPMFDGGGRLVGISGLSFAEDFALALTGADVRKAVKRVLDGKGDTASALPATVDVDGGATSGSVHVFDGTDGQVLFLPASDTATTLHLTVDMAVRPVVSVESFLDGEQLAQSSNLADVEKQLIREVTAVRGGRPEDLPDPGALGVAPTIASRETAPGVFAIPVEADRSLLVVIGAPLIDSPTDVPWTSDLPLFAASHPVSEETLELGKSIDRVFWALDTAVDVLIDLEEGQRVEFHARSPQGDVGYSLFGPALRLDHLTMADPEGAGATFVDDTDDGLYGVDAREVYEAKTSGTHRVRLYINDDVGVLVRFSVTDCAVKSCK